MAVEALGFIVHPAAELFPLVDGAEFDALVADIKAFGLMEPVVVDADGRLIDGRNRVRACNRLGVEPAVRTYDGVNVLQFVVSHNLHRRHLTDSQRAMIAAKLATRKPGYRNETAHRSIDPHHMGEIPPSVDEAATLLGVKANTVGRAKIVIRDGTEQLQTLVANGHAPVTTAARVARELPPDEQNEYVEKVRAGADPVQAAPPDFKQRNKTIPARPSLDTSRTMVALRVSTVRELAAGGNTSAQIAKLTGLAVSGVKALAAREGIVIPADAIIRGNAISGERIIDETIALLEGIASGLALIEDVSSFDATKRKAWSEALRQPLAAITRLHKELRE